MKIYLSIVILVIFSACTTKEVENKDELIQPKREITQQKTKDFRYKEDDPMVERFDVNQDGVADMWKIYQNIVDGDQTKKVLIRREIDLTYDNNVNYIKFYTPNGDIEKEYLDKDSDGTIESIRHYESNTVSKIEEFTKNPIKEGLTLNPDIKPFKIYYYNPNGVLKKITKDNTGDGQEDYFLYYISGKLDRIGIDEDGDLKIDKWIKNSVDLKKEVESNSNPLENSIENKDDTKKSESDIIDTIKGN
ncbi:hypothetical protein JXR93_06670 [bacterium]|nr:hypothetical protein [bacterium]